MYLIRTCESLSPWSFEWMGHAFSGASILILNCPYWHYEKVKNNSTFYFQLIPDDVMSVLKPMQK